MVAAKFWEFVKLESTSKRRVEMIVAAKSYLQTQLTDGVELSDAAIARHLWQQLQQSHTSDTESTHLAEICLRCYISYQVYQVCLDLALRFGSRHGFRAEDLFPFVLDDEVILTTSEKPRVRKSTYESLATKLLKTFDPTKGTLNSWVNRYVKQNLELKRFLLQHGVLLISDWALLNNTNPKQLQRILAEMYHLTPGEIEQICQLLISYHAVYREERLQQKLSGVNVRCQIPTSEQLSEIAQDLQNRTNRRLSEEAVLKQLQAIAQKLRQYRIVAQGGHISSVAYDQPEIQPIVERSLRQAAPTQITQDDETEKFEFINLYQQQFLEALDTAISQVVESFITQIQRKRSANQEISQSFVTGLHLFHCQGKPMSQIAPELGMKKQYEVTRLLKLNDLRADIRQKLLIILRDRVLEIAEQFTDAQRLENLENQLEVILDEQITTIIEEAESETRNPQRNQPLCGLLARRLCRYLEAKRADK
ncbi:hypothetical protein H6G33_20145 [Calothrix sp. FACHB-1219]|uniref:hypothetical protein n=1 Tax=unclassified Calothrix TaxID=2619626 RepID=UPI00168A2F96|nr:MULTISPECIES: hypothetical protein [unclassified Calothrix]MBD2204537.1 hypothetical protein [Calothrix sp. FACHB-168]MBD2219335.1 hypothetical protein [Calothrix sp. FACHB-1219]